MFGGSPMSLTLAKRLLTEPDKRLLWKFAYNFGYKGMRAVGRFKKRMRRGEYFPAFLFISVTNACNLSCQGCWVSQSNPPKQLAPQTLDNLIRECKAQGSYFFGILGGEPLLYDGLFEVFEKHPDCYFLLFTNGTLITKDIAAELKKIGLSYVGVSLDGLQPTHDRFRGRKGAFEKAIEGIRNCREAGIKVGLRFTVNRHNVADVPAMFDLMRKEKIERMCFYHMVYSGRGSKLREEDLAHEESRRLLDLIADKTKAMFDDGLAPEILTVDNHADGPYLYLKMKEKDPARAAEILELLEMNEGNSTGVGVGSDDAVSAACAERWSEQPGIPPLGVRLAFAPPEAL
mgnify:CR=1 FL=1